MPLAEFELVMLESGEVALQRSGADDALVTINFSPEVMAYLDGRHLEVAKSMMDSGIQMAFELGEERVVLSESIQGKAHTVH